MPLERQPDNLFPEEAKIHHDVTRGLIPGHVSEAACKSTYSTRELYLSLKPLDR